eukprot:CAMPEP_0194544316 /NCGR_PEP_ID=MMETSP0253-20130528/87357_1 /TAXON_ID=2966 /ORGANISM="Noctiluca scintillans" /LENGTH=66 /DNA_ID=CAMNT_0039391193 /DNA_START=246 /DNA_END=442 /DNA_ORIENTATION=+
MTKNSHSDSHRTRQEKKHGPKDLCRTCEQWKRRTVFLEEIAQEILAFFERHRQTARGHRPTRSLAL